MEEEEEEEMKQRRNRAEEEAFIKQRCCYRFESGNANNESSVGADLAIEGAPAGRRRINPVMIEFQVLTS